MGRKPSTDPSVAMSIYPPRSLKQKLDTRADKTPGATSAGLAVDLIREGIDRLERGEKRAKSNA